LLLIDVNDIFPNAENNSSKLSSNRDNILGIVNFLFFVSTVHDNVPVDCSWLNSSKELEKELTVTHALILKTGDVVSLTSND